MWLIPATCRTWAAAGQFCSGRLGFTAGPGFRSAGIMSLGRIRSRGATDADWVFWRGRRSDCAFPQRCHRARATAPERGRVSDWGWRLSGVLSCGAIRWAAPSEHVFAHGEGGERCLSALQAFCAGGDGPRGPNRCGGQHRQGWSSVVTSTNVTDVVNWGCFMLLLFLRSINVG